MRLSAKLSLLIIGIVILLMFTMILYVNRSLNQHITKGQQAWTERLRLTIAEGIVDNLRHGNVHKVQELLQNIASDNTIEHVYITDFEGNLFAHSFTTAFPAVLKENLTQHQTTGFMSEQHTFHQYETKNSTIYEFDEPIVPGSKATLFIGINQKQLRAFRMNTFKGIIYPTLLIGLLGVFIALFLARRINRPLYSLSEQIRRYGQGEVLSPMALSTSDKEIKQLAYSFKQMVEARKQAEAASMKSEARVRLLLESTEEALYGVNEKGICIFANPASAHILGYSHPNELMGKNMHKLVHHTRHDGSPYPVAECKLYKAHLLGTRIKGDDEYFWRKDKSCFPIEYSSYPIKHDGGITGSVVSFRDITYRKQSLEALKNIAAGVSGQTGEAFFQQLIQRLAVLFNVNYAYLGLIDKSDPKIVNTFVFYDHGNIVENFSFPYENTPCGEVIGKRPCAYPDNLQQLFPHAEILKSKGVESYVGIPLIDSKDQPLGVIAVFNTRPMTDVEQMQDVLQIFAARAAAEVERLDSEQQLRSTQQKL
ncbi:MAG: PAS domain S-box protein, partial [Halobacteria archaeon]|nr:PAS domain S-box protein [Halobacteria archaeon]